MVALDIKQAFRSMKLRQLSKMFKQNAVDFPESEKKPLADRFEFFSPSLLNAVKGWKPEPTMFKKVKSENPDLPNNEVAETMDKLEKITLLENI